MQATAGKAVVAECGLCVSTARLSVRKKHIAVSACEALPPSFSPCLPLPPSLPLSHLPPLSLPLSLFLCLFHSSSASLFLPFSPSLLSLILFHFLSPSFAPSLLPGTQLLTGSTQRQISLSATTRGCSAFSFFPFFLLISAVYEHKK